MNIIFTLLALFCAAQISFAQVLEVGPGRTYATLSAAAQQASPGDTILVAQGTHAGGDYIAGLQGNAQQWITIRAETPGGTIVRGGGNAWQFTDAAYLRIEGFIFEGQTGNGINIDDGGSYDTPTHHLVLENCEWRALNASGNNDQLKLSGLDSFAVRNCRFIDGSDGGSCIDMVGCHWGMFEGNTFTDAGSNGIQAKGGTRNISIQHNRFQNGGQRGINIGGSTGLQFFRPLGVLYEASEIGVYSNVFIGGVTAFAYVGAVNSEAVNNTIVLPEKWVFRILQETTEPGFLPCGDNRFVNNLVYIDSRAASPSVNIGPNTAPETFAFTSNLWYHSGNASWSGPNLPAAETGGILNRDPLFTDVSSGDFSLAQGSPAIGMGADVAVPEFDIEGFKYNTPRSIGAYEGNRVPLSIDPLPGAGGMHIAVFPNPSRGASAATVSVPGTAHTTVALYDGLGRKAGDVFTGTLEGRRTFELRPPNGAAPGTFFLVVRTAAGAKAVPVTFIK